MSLGERSPADHAYWAGKGWLERGRRYFVDVLVNPVYHTLGTVVDWHMRRIRRDLREVGEGMGQRERIQRVRSQ